MKTQSSAVALAALALLVTVATAAAEPKLVVPPGPEIIQKIKSGHPRLLANAGDFAAIKQRTETGEPFKTWRANLRANGEKMLAQEPSKYEIPDGLRLLATSRRVLERVRTLAMLYRLDGDKKWAERVWMELQTAAAFKDWNAARHFLDTAEMTAAFAIGYDWLYDVWTDEQRATLRTAIIDKGLTPALGVYRKKTWWAVARHNWNQVCNGGIGLGALAIGDEAPELAGEILHDALESIPLAMREFAPDGAWLEGPGYWGYATTYNVLFVAALDSALGTDFGLSGIPGFNETGDFPVFMAGPAGKTFNYADGGDKAGSEPQLFWLARRFKQPAWAESQRKLATGSAYDLLWAGAPATGAPPAFPLDKYFRKAEVVSMRSAWNDPNALCVAFKAGDNKANHSHLDLGSFVLDALGQRFILDLGADDYNLPGYFGGERWNYYRLRAEGHNTLVLNPGTAPDQDPKAFTRITRFESQPQRAVAIANLTPAYAKNAAQVQRGVALLDRRQVLLQDEIKATKAADLWWFLHTAAQVEIGADGQSATLTMGKARLQASLLSPAEAKFAVMDAAPLPTSPHPEPKNGKQQRDNKGIRKLTIHLENATEARLSVLLTPLREGETAPAAPAVKPLAEW